MNHSPRIQSVVNSITLPESITGFPSFSLSQIKIGKFPEEQLPTNLRLGHFVERIVSMLIRNSSNFTILAENLQLIDRKRTIGELDFVIQDRLTLEVIHMELAYKFYLFDPSISNQEIGNWIGPNRNDSLVDKLQKLKEKQFPLLNHSTFGEEFPKLDVAHVSQQLCFAVCLFVPYKFKGELSPVYEKGIKGFYLDLPEFLNLNHPEKLYYIPQKKEWGIDPQYNENWQSFEEIKDMLESSLTEKQAPLIWQKDSVGTEAFFVVWW